ALGKKGLSYALENISDLTNMASNLTSVSRDLAAETLAKAMISEGMTPQDVLRRLEQLGPEAIPADVNQSFREILRAASNYSPFVTGEARGVLVGRQQGAGQRIQNALNLTFPGTVDDFIESVDNQMGPQIRQLYDQASQNPIQMSERLRNMIVGESSMGRAAREAERRLLDKRAAGDRVSNFDLVDETKKVLDDQIGAALREGKRNEARNLIRLRNVLVQEADAAAPEYAQARQMYAGRAAISDAADIGGEFFQTPRRELIDLASGMTQIERIAYTLSAKEAILDRIDNTGMNRDQVAALFGKNGDVAKLRTLFDNETQFNNFTRALRRETDFLLTRRAVLENSTTTKQMQQM
ncbi:MAG: hypothetical protein ACO23R_19710, partial [bacterium]